MSHLDLRRLSGAGRFIQIEFKTPRFLSPCTTSTPVAAEQLLFVPKAGQRRNDVNRLPKHRAHRAAIPRQRLRRVAGDRGDLLLRYGTLDECMNGSAD
jgi:hypothetical protein